MASSRRTRSQLALPAFDLNQLARSPLKDARQALRTNQSPQSNPETELLLYSPLHKQPKRPSSPFKGASTDERDFKRARHDDPREENRSPLLGPRRPPSASSIRDTVPSDTPTMFRRAQSVPIWPSAPLIDLTRVPRSPSKPSPVLQFTALPPVQFEPASPELPPQINTDDAQLARPCTPEQATSPPASPLSPLTPLTDTPALPGVAEPSSDDLTPAPSSALSAVPFSDVDTPRPVPLPPTSVTATPSTGPSRLPRLSFMPSSKKLSPARPSKASSKRQEKARAQLLGPIPLGGRMTRSAALRQRENLKKDVEAAPKAVAGPSTPAPLRFTPAKAVPAAADLSNKPTPLGLGTDKRGTFSFSFAQPTASSAARSTPASPEKGKGKEKAGYALPVPSTSSSSSSSDAKPSSAIGWTPNASTQSDGTPLNSSLSSLSLALQKLSMPAPSRPGTSMGFHPEVPAASDGQSKARPTYARPPVSQPHPHTSQTQTHPRPNSAAAGPVRAPSLQRAATVSDFFRTPRHATRAPPTAAAAAATPAPTTTITPASGPNSGSAMGGRPPERQKRINVYTGIVPGKPRGNLSFGKPSSATAGGAGPTNTAPGPSSPGKSAWSILPPPASKQNVFGGGGAGRRGVYPGSRRLFPRASKKSSLPVVEGSPVKGGAEPESGVGEEKEEAVNEQGASIIAQAVERERADADKSVCADPAGSLAESIVGEEEQVVDESMPPPPLPHKASTEDPSPGAANAPTSVKRDPSRRASIALKLFRESRSQTQSAQPSPRTPVPSSSTDPPAGPSTDSPALAKRHAPPSAFHHFNLRQRPEPRSAPSVLRRSGSGSHVSGRKEKEDGEGKGKGKDEGGMRGVLRECTVFVDVRTDDGDDAGGLFVDMLADMGAKVLTRVGQTCTHVVFKNGLLSTLTRYRLLKDPRPLVVGIAWVVECAEQCTRVDESRFLISLDGVNVAGTQKRRRSMLPRQFHSLQSAEADAASPDNASPNLAFVPRVTSPTMAADGQRSSSPSVVDTDEANRSGSSLSMHPLEKARSRRLHGS